MTFNMPTMTYKNLMDKYPEAKKDIEIMRDEKNYAIKITIGVVFILSVILGYVLGKVV